ncbi:hypothetical protein [Actinomadura sp. 3N508]|uniref:hypothetical protein n=1 Tax=Actinomadura sp. 3N508 TaxID=3375153 RepID=UPI0037975F2B
MPILAAPPGAGPGAGFPKIGFAVATWRAPDGTTWPLTDWPRGWFTESEGVSGLDAAPIELATDDRTRGGAGVRHIQPQPRSIVWPLHVYGDDHSEFLGRWRALMAAFTQTTRLGPGTLEIARPDGTARRIDAYYQGGFEGQGKQGTGITSDNAVITLFCEDPYWRDTVAQPVHREFATGEDYLQPYPSISSGQVLGATTILVRGEVDAWPDWVITGPASLITATHEDTGEAFALDPDAPDIGHGNLLAGEQVTISTDPPRVRYQDGSNWTAALNWPGAVLWPLRPGPNSVTFQLDGAAAGSAVDLSFFPRYESA